MRRVLMVVFLLAASLPLWSQQSTPEKDGSTTCFSDSELADFEAEVQAEVERATLAGVSAAIAPLYVQIAEDQQRIKLLSNQRWLFVGTTSIATVGLVAALYVLSTLIKPIAP